MNACGNIFCFSPETEIRSNKGALLISRIEVGDSIMNSDPYEQSPVETRVVRTVVSSHSIIASLHFSNDKNVVCTLDHPFWVPEAGWSAIQNEVTERRFGLQTAQLSIGSRCTYFDGNRMMQVRLNAIKLLYGDYVMYDIAGATNGTFFANGFLVHDENLGCMDLRNIGQYEGVTVQATG